MSRTATAIETIPAEFAGVDLHGLIPPRVETLAKYGLTPLRWLYLAQLQNFVCAVCLKLPASGRLCCDHVHVRGWAAMPPEARVLHIRGLLCFLDNKQTCGRGMDPGRLRRGADYMERALPFRSTSKEQA